MVARKAEVEIQSALDRLMAAGLLFRQGVPPHATYLFKHALVQDAAYGTLLRGPRRAFDARIVEAHPRKPIRRDCREPARTVGTSLHRGRTDRESRRTVGQSGMAVADRARRWSRASAQLTRAS